MALTPLAFTALMTDHTAFPTDPGSEDAFRAQHQRLHSEARDYINNTVKPIIDTLQGTPFVNKTDGNGANLFNHDNSLITLYAVDKGTPSNYLFAVGVKLAGLAPTLNIVNSTVLSLGVSNTQGTQVISSGNVLFVTCVGTSIPLI